MKIFTSIDVDEKSQTKTTIENLKKFSDLGKMECKVIPKSLTFYYKQKVITETELYQTTSRSQFCSKDCLFLSNQWSNKE